jgi:hypothetical protein
MVFVWQFFFSNSKSNSVWCCKGYWYYESRRNVLDDGQLSYYFCYRYIIYSSCNMILDSLLWPQYYGMLESYTFWTMTSSPSFIAE